MDSRNQSNNTVPVDVADTAVTIYDLDPDNFLEIFSHLDLRSKLMFAATNKWLFQYAQTVIAHDEIEARDRLGRTPLLQAVHANDLAYASLLLTKYQANFNARINNPRSSHDHHNGLNALDLAIRAKNSAMIAMLMRHGADFSDCVMFNDRRDHGHVVNACRAYPAFVYQINHANQTPLEFALKKFQPFRDNYLASFAFPLYQHGIGLMNINMDSYYYNVKEPDLIIDALVKRNRFAHIDPIIFQDEPSRQALEAALEALNGYVKQNVDFSDGKKLIVDTHHLVRAINAVNPAEPESMSETMQRLDAYHKRYVKNPILYQLVLPVSLTALLALTVCAATLLMPPLGVAAGTILFTVFAAGLLALPTLGFALYQGNRFFEERKQLGVAREVVGAAERMLSLAVKL